MRPVSFPLAIALVACRADDFHGHGDATISKVADVLVLPAITSDDLDVLFMIDDTTNLDMEVKLHAAFPVFLNSLDATPGGRPNLHIGVVTSDLGTKGAGDPLPAPSVGSGPGSCAGEGKQGKLQTYGTTLVTGNFISDTKNTDGTRSTNYTGSLAAAFTSISSVGAAGCGFEQSLEAVKRALDNNPANAGFLRPAAGLLVVLFSDEDDCSMEHSTLISDSSLGPLASFRCTRYGVTCETGGTTPDDMNMIGDKAGCHSNEQSAYLTHVGDYVTFLQGLKTNATDVMVAAIVGDATPVAVEPRAPPGGGTPISGLVHSCMYTDMNGQAEVADPAVRTTDFANRFARSTVQSICGDMEAGLGAIAAQVGPLVGNTCLSRSIVLPADCSVFDLPFASTPQFPAPEIPIAPCPQLGADCYELLEDAAECPTSQHLKLRLSRVAAPPPTNTTTVRCSIP